MGYLAYLNLRVQRRSKNGCEIDRMENFQETRAVLRYSERTNVKRSLRFKILGWRISFFVKTPIRRYKYNHSFFQSATTTLNPPFPLPPFLNLCRGRGEGGTVSNPPPPPTLSKVRRTGHFVLSHPKGLVFVAGLSAQRGLG